jgi:hypothetical protein
MNVQKTSTNGTGIAIRKTAALAAVPGYLVGPGDVKVHFEEVTPSIAEQWLKQRAPNRPVRAGAVDKYADAVASDNWLINGDTIRFDKDDNLIDGQHRLHAIVKSGRTVTMIIIEGLEPAAKTTIDDNVPRSHADRLIWFDGQTRGRNVAAIVAVIRMAVYNSDAKVGYHRIKEVVDAYRSGIEWATKAVPGARHYLAVSPIFAAIAYAYDVNPEKVADFVDQVATGVDLKPKSATLEFFKWASSTKFGSKGAHRIAVFYKTLRAIQSHIEGREVANITGGRTVLNVFPPAEDR